MGEYLRRGDVIARGFADNAPGDDFANEVRAAFQVIGIAPYSKIRSLAFVRSWTSPCRVRRRHQRPDYRRAGARSPGRCDQ